MTMLTHPTSARWLDQPNARGSDVSNPASHVAMIKRCIKFAGALALIVIAVAAVASIKLAIYYPHYFH